MIGRDGTIHECVNGLKEYPDVPVTCIPSGNDFMRDLTSGNWDISTLEVEME